VTTKELLNLKRLLEAALDDDEFRGQRIPGLGRRSEKRVGTDLMRSLGHVDDELERRGIDAQAKEWKP
jgi:hypothetical protein